MSLCFHSKDIAWLIASYFIVSAIFLPLSVNLVIFIKEKNLSVWTSIGRYFFLYRSFIAEYAVSISNANHTSNRYIRSISCWIGIVRSYIKKNQNRVIGTLSVFATTSAAFGPTISGLSIQQGRACVSFMLIFQLSLFLPFWLPFLSQMMKREQTRIFKWDGIGILLFGFS